ncbi:MAG: hypothetical protein IPL46_04735 [Saprospiraceae bacterium]|nr:hypothetical protein [Saprospiraceae bacterium]
MDLFGKLFSYFKQPKEETKGRAPEGVCPVCWGYQEYDDKIRILFEDEQIDVIRHRKKYTRIRKFVKEYIEGIRLKKGKIQTCPTCGEVYEKGNVDTEINDIN